MKKKIIEGLKDTATVDPTGQSLARLPHGVSFHEVVTHLDERGSTCEIYDPRWGWHPAPMVFSYFFTLRPGCIKGWAMHKKHDDRYFIMYGEMMVVLYDDRPDSPTRGLLSKFILSETNRRLVNIPAGVWHADYNVGNKDSVAVNFPTIQYDHADPDKYRLPIDTDKIPFKFKSGMGW